MKLTNRQGDIPIGSESLPNNLQGCRNGLNRVRCRARSDNSFMIFTAPDSSLFPAVEKDHIGNSCIRVIWGRLQ